MDTGLSTARQARAQHRHELRTLTYVTLDKANGGIVRNMSHEGIGVQVVAAVRPRQQLRVRFELRYPRLRVETRGEVMWATFSGQCGIRFLDMSPRTTRQINEWIFGNLLEGSLLHPQHAGPMFGGSAVEVDDGLVLSAAPRNVIELPLPRELQEPEQADDDVSQITTDQIAMNQIAMNQSSELDWLSQPLSGRGLVWTVNSLVVVAALLLFALVFLSVTREIPPWPLATVSGAALLVAALYWGFFRTFGGSSPGTRLARMVGSDSEEDEETRGARFR